MKLLATYENCQATTIYNFCSNLQSWLNILVTPSKIMHKILQIHESCFVLIYKFVALVISLCFGHSPPCQAMVKEPGMILDVNGASNEYVLCACSWPMMVTTMMMHVGSGEGMWEFASFCKSVLRLLTTKNMGITGCFVLKEKPIVAVLTFGGLKDA